jgi:hypothetical protein
MDDRDPWEVDERLEQPPAPSADGRLAAGGDIGLQEPEDGGPEAWVATLEVEHRLAVTQSGEQVVQQEPRRKGVREVPAIPENRQRPERL